MSIDKKILEEIARYKSISDYIKEQEETSELPDLPDAGTGGDIAPAGDEGGTEEIPEPVDVESDPDVEVVDDEGGDTTGEVDTTDTGDAGTEELDVTELVTTQKNISDKQDEYMENVFSKLDDLTNKLGEMDSILQRIDSLETKIEKYREKTPEEKLQLRSLDSYPYNQKLTDFFMDKQDDFEKTGKNEYVLTSDEVENFSERDIKKSFDNPFEDEKMM